MHRALSRQVNLRSVEEAVVPISDIEIGENFGRLENRSAPTPGLVESIRAVGLLQPIVVGRVQGRRGQRPYLLIAGEDRLLSVRLLGETYVRVSIRNFASEADAAVAAAVENIGRKGLSLYEKTMLVHRLVTRFQKDPEDVAIALGLRIREVRTMLRAPEVLTKDQLEAFKNAQSESAARVFLAAAQKRSEKDRADHIARHSPRGVGRPAGIPRIKPAAHVLHVQSILASDSSKGARYHGQELSVRERALANDLLNWFLSRSRIPFEKGNVDWNHPQPTPKEKDDDAHERLDDVPDPPVRPEPDDAGDPEGQARG